LLSGKKTKKAVKTVTIIILTKGIHSSA